MKKDNLLKWKHYQSDIILLTVRLVPTVQFKFSRLGGDDGGTWAILGSSIWDGRKERNSMSFQINDSWRVDETYI